MLPYAPFIITSMPLFRCSSFITCRHLFISYLHRRLSRVLDISYLFSRDMKKTTFSRSEMSRLFYKTWI